jgi:hypothetical protein
MSQPNYLILCLKDSPNAVIQHYSYLSSFLVLGDQKASDQADHHLLAYHHTAPCCNRHQ